MSGYIKRFIKKNVPPAISNNLIITKKKRSVKSNLITFLKMTTAGLEPACGSLLQLPDGAEQFNSAQCVYFYFLKATVPTAQS